MKFFQYSQPSSLHEVVDLLQAGGGSVALMAGGTDLLVQIKEHVRQPGRVIDIKKLPGLDDFTFDERSGLRLGALVTTRQVETSPIAQQHYASLCRAATDFASIQVRNRATIVGNICRASPSADTLPPLVADRAALVIHGPQGERRCAIEDFFTGPGRTTLQAGEIVTHVLVPPPPANTGKAYIKHGRRAQMELATVGVAVTITLDHAKCKEVSIVLAAVAPTPLRARAAEDVLRGKTVTKGAIEAAARAAAEESRPIGDVRASADYRREMVEVLTRRAIEQAIEEMQ